MTTLRLWVVAWLIGLLAYSAGLTLLYGQAISLEDLRAVAVVSALVFTPGYWVVYLPVLRLVRHAVPRSALATAAAVVAPLLGIVPTAALAWLQGGWIALIGREATLFYVLSMTLGVVIGLGFAALPAPAPAPETEAPRPEP